MLQSKCAGQWFYRVLSVNQRYKCFSLNAQDCGLAYIKEDLNGYNKYNAGQQPVICHVTVHASGYAQRTLDSTFIIKPVSANNINGSTMMLENYTTSCHNVHLMPLIMLLLM